MSAAWYDINWSQVVGIGATTLAMYVVLTVLIRLNGLRSLTKMSPFDFVTTLVMASIIAATVVAEEPSFLQGGVALVVVFLVQGGWARVRPHVDTSIVENEPILLMDGAEILTDNLAQTNVTTNDLYAKLRESNVLHLGQVQAVVLESTGDVSVLHGDDDDFDRDMLHGITGH